MVQWEHIVNELGTQGLDREGVCKKGFVILDNVWLDYISLIIAWKRSEQSQLLLRETGVDSGFAKLTSATSLPATPPYRPPRLSATYLA